jgi:peptidoglycan/LPS O-acetylase OafA/YrhL
MHVRGDSLALYRPDIDGLRAIAVFAVLFFHYGVRSMSGGFVGVDVFFVISGYLITKGLADDIGRNGCSVGPLLVRFYNKRIRRIAPAALVLLGVTLIAGWFMLMPGDYRSTGDSAAFSALGAGNIYFYLHTGYFDRNSDLQPLLHMWSLGVEEQFYLAWPILLTGIIWIGKGRRILSAVSLQL